MGHFKAFIRVVKSLGDHTGFGADDIVREPHIVAEDKAAVKKYLLEEYPQFFQNNKVYEKETKDQAQFFYVVIFPLYSFELRQIEEGSWFCSYCGKEHENKYVSRPLTSNRLLGSDYLFCQGYDDENSCFQLYKKEKFSNCDLPDDLHHVTAASPNYIYKITEKSTNKSYIGKTRNAPFFRWWNHLTKSTSPFGLYLSKTNLSDWIFEVLEVLPPETKNTDVFDVESKYMLQFDTIKNGFNTLISKKQEFPSNQSKLFT